MISIYNGDVLVGYEEDGTLTVTKEGTELAKWLVDGVPGMRGTIDGDTIVDAPVTIPPDDPFFGLALLDHFERIG